MLILPSFLRFTRSLIGSYNDPDIKGLIEILIFIICLGTIFYHYSEGWSLLDSLYFSVATLLTVGYGNFAPQTVAGKIFTIIYLFIGVGAFLGFVNLYIQHHRNSTKKERGS